MKLNSRFGRNNLKVIKEQNARKSSKSPSSNNPASSLTNSSFRSNYINKSANSEKSDNPTQAHLTKANFH